MIKRFGFKNFGSFRDGAEINFVSQGQIGSVLGVKGANGSGKTLILKALVFLHCFCSKRMGGNKDASPHSKEIDIPVETFFHNGGVCEFYIEFFVNNTTYYYELDVRRNGISREVLTRKRKKEITCLVREKAKVVYCLNEFDELKSLKLKANQPVISVVSDFEFHHSMNDLQVVYYHFLLSQFNVDAGGYQLLRNDDYYAVSAFYHEHPEALEFAKVVICGADDGVSDIHIEESVDKGTGETIYFPTFEHVHEDQTHLVGLPYESMGTKSLFLNMHKYWLAINSGGLLVLDEFDTHLHAMLLPEIIRLFSNKIINKNGAQLVITAHNTEVIDALGRDRVYLVNKEKNISYCYRLDEIKLLRNDRKISPLYSKGKIGGTPRNIHGLTDRLAREMDEK